MIFYIFQSSKTHNFDETELCLSSNLLFFLANFIQILNYILLQQWSKMFSGLFLFIYMMNLYDIIEIKHQNFLL